MGRHECAGITRAARPFARTETIHSYLVVLNKLAGRSVTCVPLPAMTHIIAVDSISREMLSWIAKFVFVATHVSIREKNDLKTYVALAVPKAVRRNSARHGTCKEKLQ